MSKHYTSIYVCPTTGKQLSNRQMAYSKGICPICGDTDGEIMCHNEKIIGYYKGQPFWESLFNPPTFIRKE